MKSTFVLCALALAIAPKVWADEELDVWSAPPSLKPQFLESGPQKCPPNPKRIVSLAPSTTELIFALGAGSRVVGVTKFCDFPREASKLPKIGGFLDPNPEVVLSLKPDCVIGAPNSANKAQLERVAKAGAPVLIVPGNSFSDFSHAAKAVAPVLGGDAQERADLLLEQMKKDLTELSLQSKKRAKVRAAFVYDQKPLVLAGPGSFAHTMFELLSVKNTVSIDQPYPTYSAEQLILDAPDVVFDATGPHARASDFWSRFSALKAVKDGRVYELEDTSLLRPGPRMVDAVRELSRRLEAQGARSISK